MKNKGNKKLIVYVNLWVKKYQIPPAQLPYEIAPPKISKKLSPRKMYQFKILQFPQIPWRGSEGGFIPQKMCLVWLFGSASLKVSVLFDVNSNKKCEVLFCMSTLKVSELFHVNSKIIPLLFSKSCIPVNLLKTEVLYRH